MGHLYQLFCSEVNGNDMKRRIFGVALLVALLNPAIGVKAFGDEVPALDIWVENYEVQFPVSDYVFETQKQTLAMA
mgnify:CR=1 FL=1